MAAMTAVRPTTAPSDTPTLADMRLNFKLPGPAAKASAPATPLATTAPSPTAAEPQDRAGPVSRRDRPCDACRRRKTRCVIDEGGQVCSLCRMHRQLCTFVEDPLPRKKRSSSHGPLPESAKRRSSVTPKEQSTAPASPAQSAVAVSTELGHLAGTRDAPSGMHLRRSVHYVGPTTEVEPYLMALCSLDESPAIERYHARLRRFGAEDTFLVHDRGPSQLGHAGRAQLDAFEMALGPSAPALVELYFDRVHPGFPILPKREFLDRYRTSASLIATPLLAAVYLLAMRWWSRGPALRGTLQPDVGLLRTVAMRSLEAAMHRPDISTLQAGLLLLQQPDGRPWTLTTQLVACAQDLGFHLDSSTWGLSASERGLRKRVGWALFMQDKWGALVYGRPSHIVSANWAVRPLTEEDFDDQDADADDESAAESETSRLLFGRMIALTEILSDVVETLYTLRATHEVEAAGAGGGGGTKIVLERAKPIQIKLKDWYARLPGRLRMDDARRLSSIGYLHLAYFATEMTLHRRIVRSLNPAATEPYLLHICRSAAKTRLISAMDFVNRLKVEHLQSFWYFASKVNFALIGTFGSLLWATAPSRQEADFYRLRLAEFRWTLTVNSRRAHFIGFAVETLDMCTRMLANLDEKPSLSPEVGLADLSTGPSRGTDRGTDASGRHRPGNLDAGTQPGEEDDDDGEGEDLQLEYPSAPSSPPSSSYGSDSQDGSAPLPAEPGNDGQAAEEVEGERAVSASASSDRMDE